MTDRGLLNPFRTETKMPHANPKYFSPKFAGSVRKGLTQVVGFVCSLCCNMFCCIHLGYYIVRRGSILFSPPKQQFLGELLLV